MLSESAKKIRQNYMKAWRESNKEKIKQYQIQYWEKQSKKLKEKKV